MQMEDEGLGFWNIVASLLPSIIPFLGNKPGTPESRGEVMPATPTPPANTPNTSVASPMDMLLMRQAMQEERRRRDMIIPGVPNTILYLGAGLIALAIMNRRN